MMTIKPCEAWAMVLPDGELLSLEMFGVEAEGARKAKHYRALGDDVRLARVQISEGWRDIADAPKDGTVVDIWYKNRDGSAERLAGAKFVKGAMGGEYWIGPKVSCPAHLATHFMPLPAPPESEGK